MKLFHQLEDTVQAKVLALCGSKIIESIQNSTFEFDKDEEEIQDLEDFIRNDNRFMSDDYNTVNQAVTDLLKDEHLSSVLDDLSYDVATRSYYAEPDDNVIFLPDVEDHAYQGKPKSSIVESSDDPSTDFGKQFTDDFKKKFNLN